MGWVFDLMKREILVERILLAVFLVFALAFLFVLIFANYIYYNPCENLACFNDYLESCDRAKHVYVMGDSVFEYKIFSRSSEVCFVKVTLARDESLKDLKGQSMVCDIPRGLVAIPGLPNNDCHGLLKEGLNDEVISRLQRYVVQNIGEINEDF
jgi:hypothetical protein